MDFSAALRGFDQGFKAIKPDGQFIRRPGMDTLKDGDYEFEITGVELGATKDGDVVVRFLLEVKTGPSGIGSTVEHVHFLNDQSKVNYLGADLVTLGLDANLWQPEKGRAFSVELPKRIGELTGKRFKGHKKENVSKGKSYHNLYVNQLLMGETKPMPGGSSSRNTDVEKSVAERDEADEIPF